MAEYIEREDAKVWIANALSLIPSTDVQPVVHGRWLTEYEPDGKPYCFHCSVCDSDFSIIRNKIAYDYCPDCGAKMDGET